MPTTGSGSASGVISGITYAEWPTVEEVETRLEEMGVTSPPSAGTLQGLIDAAIQDWEDYTGWHPFLSDGEETTEYFTAVGNIVDFIGTGLIGNSESFIIGGNYDEDGVYTGGQTLVINRDFRPMRTRRSWPYTYAKFNSYWTDDSLGGVAITGVFGFSTTIPANVWEAIMEEVLDRVTVLGQASTGVVVEMEEDDVRIKYADTTKSSTDRGLSAKARMTADFYRRLEVA